MQTIAFFDLDGTLTNPQVGISTCIVHALDVMGHRIPDQATLDGWIGPPLLDSFCDYLGSAVLAAEALELYRERFGAVGMFENEVYAGIEDALRRIATRCDAMFVVTSKPRVFAQTIVEHFGLAPFFASVYGSELDGSLTDKGELIAHVMRQEALQAGAVTMIGDRRHDIIGARKNDMRSVGVLWGFGTRCELEKAGASRLCGSVVELHDAFFGADKCAAR